MNSPDFLDKLMQAALSEAQLAYQEDEVPIGAVISKDSQIIAQAHNLVEANHDCTQHAEVLVIKEAVNKLGDWRLNDCTICVTLEPCTMCLGAIKLARIPKLIYALDDPQKGACGSLFDLTEDQRLGPPLEVIRGIREAESKELLQSFFKSKRS